MVCGSWSHFGVEHLNNVTVKFQLEQFFGDESAISFSFKTHFLEFLDGEGFMSQAFLRCCYNTSKHPNRITKKNNTQISNKHTPILEDMLLSNVPFLSFFCLFFDFSLGWTLEDSCLVEANANNSYVPNLSQSSRWDPKCRVGVKQVECKSCYFSPEIRTRKSHRAKLATQTKIRTGTDSSRKTAGALTRHSGLEDTLGQERHTLRNRPKNKK